MEHRQRAGIDSSFTFSAGVADGVYEFYTVAVDVAGNREAAPGSADDSTRVDRVNRQSQASSPDYSNDGSVSVGYTASDAAPASGLDRVELWAKAPGGSFVKVDTDPSPGASGSFAFSAGVADGSYEFYTVAVDKAGNVESAPGSADDSTFVDRVKPQSQASSPDYSNTGSVSVGYTASDVAPASGLDRVELWAKAPGGSFTKVATDTGLAIDNSFAFSAGVADGSYEFYTVAVDKAGNVESAPGSADDSTFVDRVKPQSQASSPDYSNTGSVSVGYTASDVAPASGLDRVELWAKAPGGSFTKVATDTGLAIDNSFAFSAGVADGSYEFYTVAVDKAGNVESAPGSADDSTFVDRVAPLAAVTFPTNGGNYSEYSWDAVADHAGDVCGTASERRVRSVARPRSASISDYRQVLGRLGLHSSTERVSLRKRSRPGPAPSRLATSRPPDITSSGRGRSIERVTKAARS